MTPMQQQYDQIKAQYPDCIILFRLGDFYEVFDDDAKVVSEVLGITLTGRGKNENRRPMAGIPHHALNTYLPKLIAQGFKVAIADQTEEAKPGKLVNREVTKIITPGTVLDEMNIDPSRNNYIASLYIDKSGQEPAYFALSFADITTGEMRAFISTNAKEVSLEIQKIAPAELLTNLPNETAIIYSGCPIEIFSEEIDAQSTESYLSEYFKTERINHFFPKDISLEKRKCLIISSSQLLHYICEKKRKHLSNITKISLYDNDTVMKLDETAFKNLEIFFCTDGSEKNSLFSTFNHCKTPMGKRLLRKWFTSPSKDAIILTQRYEMIDHLHNNNILLMEIMDKIKFVHDIERLVSRIASNSINPKEVITLSQSLEIAQEVLKLAQNIERFTDNINEEMFLEVREINSKILMTLDPEPSMDFSSGKVVKDGFDEEVDRLRNIKIDLRHHLLSIQQREIQATGISSLKIAYNQVFGYYIEVSKTNLSKVPQHYLRKQTLSNAERFITEELKNLEEEVIFSEQKLLEKQKEIFGNLVTYLSEKINCMLSISALIAELDVITNLANLSRERGYTKPIISATNEIRMGRHPVVELQVNKFVPNDVHFTEDYIIHIITGPNMSGKSTFIRQVAIIYFLAQIGSFVPAQTFKFTPVDRIFTRIGSADNLSSGESTFMVEMMETANILNNATSESLIVLDEIGRGTSTFDGVAIAWSVVEYINDHIKAKTLFATHYHELTQLENKNRKIKNFSVLVEDNAEKIKFTYKVVSGSIGKSYGIHVAQMAGIPKTVISRAKFILKQFENTDQSVKASKLKARVKKSSPVVKKVDPSQLSLI